MKKFWKIFRICIDIWGGISLVLALFLGYQVLNTFIFSKNDFAKKDDVMFILNWGNIGKESKVVEVIHSYKSSRNKLAIIVTHIVSK